MAELKPVSESRIVFGLAQDEPWAEELEKIDWFARDPELERAFGW